MRKIKIVLWLFLAVCFCWKLAAASFVEAKVLTCPYCASSCCTGNCVGCPSLYWYKACAGGLNEGDGCSVNRDCPDSYCAGPSCHTSTETCDTFGCDGNNCVSGTCPGYSDVSCIGDCTCSAPSATPTPAPPPPGTTPTPTPGATPTPTPPTFHGRPGAFIMYFFYDINDNKQVDYVDENNNEGKFPSEFDPTPISVRLVIPNKFNSTWSVYPNSQNSKRIINQCSKLIDMYHKNCPSRDRKCPPENFKGFSQSPPCDCANNWTCCEGDNCLELCKGPSRVSIAGVSTFDQQKSFPQLSDTIGDIGGCEVDATFSITLPQGFEVSNVKMRGDDPGFSPSASGTTYSWTTKMRCLGGEADCNYCFWSLGGDPFAWNTVPMRVAIRKARKPPEVISLSSSISSSGVYLGQTVTFTTTFRDKDDSIGNNLVQNGSFEDGTVGWSLEGGGTKEIVSVSGAAFGSKAIHVVGGSPRARVIQWVPVGNNTSYTLSLSSKKTGGWVKADEWCLGGAAGNRFIATRLSADNSSSYQRKISPFTSGTCNSDQDHRLAIFFDADPWQEIWVDGVLLEEGTTKGIFSDIKGFQFNLEKESSSPTNYNKTKWPLRLMFSKQHTIGGQVYRDSFYAAWQPQTGNDWGIPVTASYDSLSGKWYLPSDMKVGDKFTLVGGVDKTYFTLNKDGGIVATWTVKFESGFPLGSYNRTLHVLDWANFEDEVGETGFTILQVNGGPGGYWDFHRSNQGLTVSYPLSWFQTQEGDVHAQGTISLTIPSTCTSPGCLPYFSLKGENDYHGIVSWGGDDFNSPYFGSGQVSEDPKWQAKSQAKRSDYELFFKLLEPTLEYPRNSNGEVSNNDLPSGDGVKAYNGDIQTKNNWSIGTKKIVLLTSGKFLIKNSISIAEGGSLVVVASGGIGVSKNFGGTTNYLEGIFITDGTFYSSVNEDFNFSSTTSTKALVIRGGVIAKDFSLSRDLDNNSTTPAEKFIYRPDLVINSYPRIWKGSHIWEELAP